MQIKKENRQILLWMFFFGVAMAYLESAVVVYLRQIYYPDGFHFPIIIIPQKMALIEIGREMATLVMLLAVAFIAGKTRWTRFAYFMLSFGIWDIWYYVWLKVFLDWPASFFTWDLLFLIPAPWVGPVLAPVIVSVSLIVGALVILFVEDSGSRFQLKKWEWLPFLMIPVLIFISFILDAPLVVRQQSPEFYHWELLAMAEILGVIVFFNVWNRFRKEEMAGKQ
ncbi:hypothetical protein B6D60_11740 [candidate division KSB1 bacterium 4484_87]|nr:MAG: hypothetical protein B6D60_11740 [candidate division KSB1 bacterium 4484_87]